jgi:lysyl endopeptidase
MTAGLHRTRPAAAAAIVLGVILAAAAGPSRAAVRPLSAVPQHLSPAVAAADLDALAAEDAARAAAGEPYRFALPEDVSLTPAGSGLWDETPEGAARWRLRIGSPGALSLNLGFTQFWLPAGATLTVGPVDGGEGVTFDDLDNAPHGQLWTPVRLADELLVELVVPARLRGMVLLEVGRIGRGYRLFGEPAAAGKSGACNIDVVCAEGDPWRSEIAAVGMVSRGGVELCSGAMINNTANDGRALFLSAYHCNVTSATAPSVVIYWNFESPSCGQQGGGSLDQFTSGSSLLASWATSDFLLLELDEQPEPSYGVKYAGWDRSGALPGQSVAIHHPSVDEKSISFEYDPVQLSTYLQPATPGDGTHLRVNDWDLGTTEGGSSGSPLFDENHRIVGQLHGGYAACGNDLADWYGRLFTSWTGGGSATTRLSDWLDPQGTGALTADTFDPWAGGFTVTPEADAVFEGPAGGPFAPTEAAYVLTSDGAPAAFLAAMDADWAEATPGQGSVPAGGSATVTVRLTAAALELPPGVHRATLTVTNAGQGPGGATRAVVLNVVGDRPEILARGPNPFRDFIEVSFSLGGADEVSWRVLDMRGREVRGPRTQEGSFGVNTLAWGGDGDDGRRLPSGHYVIELTAAGLTQRTRVALVR